MSPRPSTRDRLLAATTSLIAERGWGQVSARNIAAAAGVSLGVVHYHADSVDDLRRSAAMGAVRRFFAEAIAVSGIGRTDPSTMAAVDSMERLFDAVTPADPHQPELIVLYESLVAAVHDPPLREQIASSLHDFRVLLTEWFEACCIANPAAIAACVTAIVDGFLLQRAVDPSLSPDTVMSGLKALLTGGTKASSPYRSAPA